MVASSQCMLEGLGVPLDLEEGMVWVRKACAAKNPQGMYDMATCLYTGEPSEIPGLVEEDEDAAFELYKQTAQLGHVGAMFMLGDCYLDGIGTHKDLGKTGRMITQFFVTFCNHGKNELLQAERANGCTSPPSRATGGPGRDYWPFSKQWGKFKMVLSLTSHA